MNHADFVVWMLGYPLVIEIMETMKHRWGQRATYSDDTRAIAGFLHLVIWLVVGLNLY